MIKDNMALLFFSYVVFFYALEVVLFFIFKRNNPFLPSTEYKITEVAKINYCNPAPLPQECKVLKYLKISKLCYWKVAYLCYFLHRYKLKYFIQK